MADMVSATQRFRQLGWAASAVTLAAVMIAAGRFYKHKPSLPENPTVQVIPLAPATKAESPRQFAYDLPAELSVGRTDRYLLELDPAPSMAPLVGVASKSGPREGATEVENYRWLTRSNDLQADWRQRDLVHSEPGPWNHFLRSFVDPLLVESDGVSFYDPSTSTDRREPVLLSEPRRGFGFGLKFRASF